MSHRRGPRSRILAAREVGMMWEGPNRCRSWHPSWSIQSCCPVSQLAAARDISASRPTYRALLVAKETSNTSDHPSKTSSTVSGRRLTAEVVRGRRRRLASRGEYARHELGRDLATEPAAAAAASGAATRQSAENSTSKPTSSTAATALLSAADRVQEERLSTNESKH